MEELKEILKERIVRFSHIVEECWIEDIECEMQVIISLLTELSYFTNVDESMDYIIKANSVLRNKPVGKPTPELAYTGGRGRPCFVIPQETLEYFISKKFTIKEMSQLVGVSEKTIVNRMKEFGQSIRQSYSDISDEELDELVKAKISEFPTIGYKSIMGHIESEGHRVQRDRLMSSVRRVDPVGVMFRNVFLKTYRIKRRVYNVRAPMALWHIDSNHKLIRYFNLFLTTGLRYVLSIYKQTGGK